MTGLGAGNCIWVLGFSGLQIALQVRIFNYLPPGRANGSVGGN